MEPTTALYLTDDNCFETEAGIVAVREDAIAFDRTCFYPGGGGQPPDEGSVVLPGGETFRIDTARRDEEGVIWHIVASGFPASAVGQRAILAIAAERRLAVSRYHTVLHVVNTIALRDYGGWITGAQIAPEYSRIDFKLERLTAALCAELETKVNAVLAGNRPLASYYVPEDEFRRREDLLRSLEAAPPVSAAGVRVVEIGGFDAQACGGTHVAATGEVGRFTITRTENKGRVNKRLYVKLESTG